MFFRLILSCIYIFLALFMYSPANAASISELKTALENYGIPFQKNIYIGETFSVDLTSLDTILQENYNDYIFEYDWNVSWASSQEWPIFKRDFQTSGQKNIRLSVYATEVPNEEDWEKTTEEVEANESEVISRNLVLESDIWFFIYEKSVPLVIDESINVKAVKDFIEAGKDLWVYIKEIGSYSEFSINGNDIIAWIEEYKVSTRESSDYIVVWWEKEFLFTTLSQINASKPMNPLNMVLVSPFNASILKSYIWNNIAKKDVLGTAFILNDTFRPQILKNPQSIEALKLQVEENNYEYTSLTQQNTISPFLFLSNFVNRLSNNAIPISDIYIILLLPLFLTLISIAKHMIGISTIGIIIPIFMSLLFIKLSVSFTLWILWFFLICNIIISRFINKYALLYTPKVACITILNLIAFMWLYQFISYFDLITIPLNNVLYILLFFIIAEKLITIIISKEFREYKKSITGTIIVALLCFLIFQLDGLRVFLVAYPETLLIFVPINFFIGRFTWLRVTEYLRFREIIKNIEE